MSKYHDYRDCPECAGNLFDLLAADIDPFGGEQERHRGERHPKADCAENDRCRDSFGKPEHISPKKKAAVISVHPGLAPVRERTGDQHLDRRYLPSDFSGRCPCQTIEVVSGYGL